MSSILIHIPSAERGNQRDTGQPVFQFCLRLRAFGLVYTTQLRCSVTWRGVYNQKSTLQVQPASRPSRRSQQQHLGYKSKPVMCARRENYDCGPCVHTYVRAAGVCIIVITRGACLCV